MKMSELRKYIEAGLSDEQIMKLATPDAGNNQPGQNVGNTGNNAVLAAIKTLTETIQASNIAGAQNKDPETIDDILGTILFDEEGDK